jgi:hypothetical protein
MPLAGSMNVRRSARASSARAVASGVMRVTMRSAATENKPTTLVSRWAGTPV